MKNELGTWYPILKDEIEKPYFKYIIHRINDINRDILCPDRSNIFRAFKETDYFNTRVVILSQDPYFSKGTANGLAFSTCQQKTPPSLRNIFKEIKDTLPNTELNSNNLVNWAKQGVLLLNATLTTEVGIARAHVKLGWNNFLKRVLQELNNHPNKIVFLLWGNDAKQLKEYITNDKHLILEAVHPSPLSANKGFFGCNHFILTNEFLLKEYNEKINFST